MDYKLVKKRHFFIKKVPFKNVILSNKTYFVGLSSLTLAPVCHISELWISSSSF
jgi:hypothetical protein